MSYATKANMIARFGEPEVIALTDRTGSLDAVDDAVLASALSEADAEIDPYLAPRHVLPLASVPKILTGFACDIARYRLSGAGVTETDTVRLRYKDAIKFLDSVASGKIGLGLDASNNVAKPANTVQFSAPNERAFDRAAR